MNEENTVKNKRLLSVAPMMDWTEEVVYTERKRAGL
jgi:hypothetical protein